MSQTSLGRLFVGAAVVYCLAGRLSAWFMPLLRSDCGLGHPSADAAQHDGTTVEWVPCVDTAAEFVHVRL